MYVTLTFLIYLFSISFLIFDTNHLVLISISYYIGFFEFYLVFYTFHLYYILIPSLYFYYDQVINKLLITIPLYDKNGQVRIIIAYGIDKITRAISEINTESISSLFNFDEIKEMKRPSGTVDLLIGYEYAAWHQVLIEAREHLLILSNIFCKCIAGSHELLNKNTQKEVVDVCVI